MFIHQWYSRIWLALLSGVALTGSFARSVAAEDIDLTESYTSGQVFTCEATVASRGEVSFTKSEDESQRAEQAGSASFRFTERRLPPAGRDALAFRSVRDFNTARMTTTVGDHRTEVSLPADAKLIVSEGYRSGVRHYSPDVKLDRDALDLLELPGDPLVLAALLPLERVAVDEEWSPSDWVMQMLTGIEAVESTKLTCRLSAANSISAKVSFEGKIQGQRFGANTTVDLRGSLIFDLRTSHVTRTQAIYTIKADVGTVYPGLDIQVTSNLVRNVQEDPGRLTRELAESIPLEPSDESLQLTFSAPEWGIKIDHGREWHLFRAVLEGTNQVAIFRLVEHGSLVCQCNFSPMKNALPGEAVPLEQFEADIQQSLGESFKEFDKTETLSLDGGRQAHRVVARGEQEVKGGNGSAFIPMTWIYYLVTDPTGKQLSFVFAIESPLLEQLEDRDLSLVRQQRFVR